MITLRPHSQNAITGIRILVFPDEQAREIYKEEIYAAAEDGFLFKRKYNRDFTFLPHDFVRVFTAERLKLLLLMKHEAFSSITALAKRTGRLFEAVHRDLKELSHYDLVHLERVGRRVIPRLNGPIEMPVL